MVSAKTEEEIAMLPKKQSKALGGEVVVLWGHDGMLVLPEFILPNFVALRGNSLCGVPTSPPPPCNVRSVDWSWTTCYR